MEDFIQVNLEFNVLVCKPCKSAIQTGATIESHFRRAHQLKGEVLRQIIDTYEGQPLRDVQHINLPRDGRRPIAELPVVHGFSCSQCRYLTISRENIHKHWRSACHECSGQNQRYRKVYLQSWKPGRYARYWEVKLVEHSGSKSPQQSEQNQAAYRGSNDEPATQLLEQCISDSAAEIEAQDTERLRKGDREENIDRDSSWVKEMQWVRHFGVRDLVVIGQSTQWPGSKVESGTRDRPWQQERDPAAEREQLILKRVCDGFGREVGRCRMRIDCVPKETLQKLQGIHEKDYSSGQPFGRAGLESSIYKYSVIGQRYLCFCVRAYRLGREEALAKLGATFTDEQWSLLADVVFAAEKGGAGPRRQGENHFISQDSGFDEGSDSGSDSDDPDDDSSEDGQDYGGDRAVTGTDELDRAVFVFMITSIKAQVGGDIYNNGLLCFYAAMGIRLEPLKYEEAVRYTAVMAAVHWIARLFFLEHQFEMEPKEATHIGIEVLHRFDAQFAQWMCVGTHTVISKIINWMAYGKGIRQKAEGQPSVRWDSDKSTLFHDGEGMRVNDFKAMARSLMKEGDRFLDTLLGGQWGSLKEGVELKRIRDNTVRLGAGRSFTTNPANSWLEAGPGKAVRAMGSRLWDACACRWKSSKIKGWLRTLRWFRETLLLLVHIWGGQPGRGPEVMTLRHCDSWQLMRNVIVYDGAVMIISDRDKMKAIRGIGRKVARFLPDQVGRMMVAYIAWLLPAERMLLKVARIAEPKEEELEYLWRHGASQHWESERLSAILGRQTKAETGVRLTLGRYRMVAIAMGREIRGIVERKVEQAAGEEEDEDGLEVDPLTGEVSAVSGSWNIVWDLQSTHSTKMARQHYAVHVGFIGSLQPEMIASYRGVSQLWHQFLMSGGGGPAAVQKRPLEGGEDIRGKGKRRAIEEGSMGAAASDKLDEEMVQGLRLLLGPLSTWKSLKQKESMQAVLRLKGDTCGICVLPTGAGKSILFMLPAVLREGGSSIVIVPFVALIDDLVDRARTLGVDVIRFDPARNMQRESLPRAARLVVVSADVALSAGFASYADGLRGSGLLRRIFIDECHTIITDAGYREKLGALVGVRRYECPTILLSATLPVVLERWFRGVMLAQSAVLVRDRTTKVNCRYRVEVVPRKKNAVEDRVVEVVKGLSRTMLCGQKGVVYCRSKNKAKALAGEIGCEYHHSGMDEGDRTQVREVWAGSRGHAWIVATTGLGTGIDVGGVVAVVHAEQPFGLVDFVQQTGRGGRRDGEVVDSIIVHDGRKVAAEPGANFVEQTNRAQMEQFVSSKECRRSVISAFMDGVGNETCGEIRGAELCDVCVAGSADESCREERGEWSQFCMEQGQREATARRWLDEVGEGCAVCHVWTHERRLQGEEWEGAVECEEPSRCFERIAGEPYEEVRQRVQFPENRCCFTCKLPSDWCAESKVGEKCAHMDKVLPVAYLALCVPRIGQMVREAFETCETTDSGLYLKWLAEKRRFHGRKGVNVHAAWEEIIWRIYR